MVSQDEDEQRIQRRDFLKDTLDLPLVVGEWTKAAMVVKFEYLGTATDSAKPSERLAVVEEPCRRSHAGDLRIVVGMKAGCRPRWKNLSEAGAEAPLLTVLETKVESEARRISSE